jgi:hypothetical protein
MSSRYEHKPKNKPYLWKEVIECEECGHLLAKIWIGNFGKWMDLNEISIAIEDAHSKVCQKDNPMIWKDIR